MRRCSYIILAIVLFSTASCTTTQNQSVWRVEETEVPLYHSSTIDAESGYMAHVEYCGAKFSKGSKVLHVVYRPIDFPNRNPGFAEGDTVLVTGLGEAKDFGSVKGRDYWIHDIRISKLANQPGVGDGR